MDPLTFYSRPMQGTEPRLRLPISFKLVCGHINFSWKDEQGSEIIKRCSCSPAIYTSNGEYGIYIKREQNTLTYVCHDMKRNAKAWSIEHGTDFGCYTTRTITNNDEFFCIQGWRRNTGVVETSVYLVTTGELVASFTDDDRTWGGCVYMNDVDMWLELNHESINIYDRCGELIRSVDGSISLSKSGVVRVWMWSFDEVEFFVDRMWSYDGKFLHYIDSIDDSDLFYLNTFDISGKCTRHISTRRLFNEKTKLMCASEDEMIFNKKTGEKITWFVFDKRTCAVTQTFITPYYAKIRNVYTWNKFLVMAVVLLQGNEADTLLVWDSSDDKHPVLKIQNHEDMFSTCLRYTKINEGWFVFKQLIVFIDAISSRYPFMTVDLITFFARNALMNSFLHK